MADPNWLDLRDELNRRQKVNRDNDTKRLTSRAATLKRVRKAKGLEDAVGRMGTATAKARALEAEVAEGRVALWVLGLEEDVAKKKAEGLENLDCEAILAKMRAIERGENVG